MSRRPGRGVGARPGQQNSRMRMRVLDVEQAPGWSREAAGSRAGRRRRPAEAEVGESWPEIVRAQACGSGRGARMGVRQGKEWSI
jgi:hypothetical protein